MKKFKFIKTHLSGLVVTEPMIFKDDRGFFMETYNSSEFAEAGLNLKFVQDNHSSSVKGVLRGLHFQYKYPQGKLVRVVKGKVFDVAVDIRKKSSTCGGWFGVVLSEENRKMLYIPEGFAHGFLVISDTAEVVYKCTGFYHPEDEGGILWNDTDIGIEWPLDNIEVISLSEKDKANKNFRSIESQLKF